MPSLKVSLYIPCFNAESTIRYCLEGVFRQTYPLKKVIVVDDGSIDKTVELASRYPVRVIRHKNNKGLAAVRNTAIKNINTEFIASLDADCVPESGWLARLMKRFTSDRIAGVGGKLAETYPSSVFDIWRTVHMKQSWEDRNTSPSFLFGSNAVFRRKALKNAGLYNENFKKNYEDVDISERLKKRKWILVYEPRGLVNHVRRDDICSMLDTYWRWNLGYYQKRRYYSNPKIFVFKLKDNIWLANRFIEEDLASNRCQLLYLDFLLAFHHSLKDFEYFSYKDKHEYLDYPPVSFWLSLIDLSFSSHLASQKDKLFTFIPKKDNLLQNFFALNLILGKYIFDKFKHNSFRRLLYKHLLFSVYKINDRPLLDSLLNLVELHREWFVLLKKRQQNLKHLFLKNFTLYFQNWLEDLIYRFPDIINKIEISAEKTDKLILP